MAGADSAARSGRFTRKTWPDGRRTFGVQVQEHHANGLMNAHGGLLMTLADMAWGNVISVERSMFWVTVRLTCDFLASAKLGEWVEAGAEILSEAEGLYTVRGRVWSGERTLVNRHGPVQDARPPPAAPGREGLRGRRGARGVSEAAAAAAPDPQLSAPLARFEGARPPAPAWFHRALDRAPARSLVEVAGCPIELLCWGERGAPGLLFLHGNGANADWWSFIAPFFARTHRVAAISWSGMGRSGWREAYTFDLLMAEALEGAQAAGLFETGAPDVVAHSFGGAVGTVMAARAGERLRSMVILDAGVRPEAERWRGPPPRQGPHRVYPDLASALARFRLMPPQPLREPVPARLHRPRLAARGGRSCGRARAGAGGSTPASGAGSTAAAAWTRRPSSPPPAARSPSYGAGARG